MKKQLGLISLALMAVALIFNLAACSHNVNGPQNELTGKTFSADFDGDMYSFDFTDDTFKIIRDEEPWSPMQYCGDYRTREEETYSYTVNSDIGYIIYKTMNLKVSYVRDGTTLYTEPDAIPETLEAYKAERTRLFKALNPSITDEQVAELLARYSNSTSEEDFNRWKTHKTLWDEAEKRLHQVLAYRWEGNNLVISGDSIGGIPQGLKFGDIFNDCYEFSYYSRAYPDFEIHVYSNTITKDDPSIEIQLTEDSETIEYTILSATNDSMTIAEVTGRNNWFITFDESSAFTCPITYTDGENKVTATVTIGGTDFSFDIEYMTREIINEILDEYETDTYTLQ